MQKQTQRGQQCWGNNTTSYKKTKKNYLRYFVAFYGKFGTYVLRYFFGTFPHLGWACLFVYIFGKM